MDNPEQRRALLRAQLDILMELDTLVEEGENFYFALIDLKSRILEELKKLPT
jgi:hypothetical protein